MTTSRPTRRSGVAVLRNIGAGGRPALLLALGLAFAGCTPEAPPPHADLLITGGLVYQGRDQALVAADVAVVADRIVAVGDVSHWSATERVTVEGLVIAPGFIDLHSHAVRLDVRRSGLEIWPQAENVVRQGVTTLIGGPDGGSPLPVAAVLARLADKGTSVNFGTFVGQGSVRREVIGLTDRPAQPDDIEAMQAVVHRAMREGAYGLSSGLIYAPGRFATTAEVAALATAAAEHDGIYISHIRNESSGLTASIDEALTIGEQAGIPVQITHLKAMGVANWGTAEAILARLEAARSAGLDVTADVYPYAASSTGLTAMFPGWALSGNLAERNARLDDPATRSRIRDHVADVMRRQRTGDDPARVQLAFCRFDTGLNGLNLAELLARDGTEVSIEAAAELVLTLQRRGGCTAVYHAMSEDDVATLLLAPHSMVASDGGVVEPGFEMPHPRNYGAFARVLARYVREGGRLSLPEALWKMAEFPAERIGLTERGRIAPGCIADLVAFDRERIVDRATFAEPNQYAEGVTHVWVAGVAVLENGAITGARPGRMLRSTDPSSGACR